MDWATPSYDRLMTASFSARRRRSISGPGRRTNFCSVARERAWPSNCVVLNSPSRRGCSASSVAAKSAAPNPASERSPRHSVSTMCQAVRANLTILSGLSAHGRIRERSRSSTAGRGSRRREQKSRRGRAHQGCQATSAYSSTDLPRLPPGAALHLVIRPGAISCSSLYLMIVGRVNRNKSIMGISLRSAGRTVQHGFHGAASTTGTA